MRKVLMALLPALVVATAGTAAQASHIGGTVNYVSEAQTARARAAISSAGYQPTVLQFAQDGNLFFTATKGGDTYGITVTPAEKIYVSVGLPSRAPSG